MKNTLSKMLKKLSKISSTLIILMFAGAIYAQVGVPAPAGLVEWWRADGSALGVNGLLNANLQSGANCAAGRVGQSFNFDGADDYVQIADNPAIDFGTGDFTVEAWVRWESALTVQNREYGFINKTAYFQNTPGWGFEITTYTANGDDAYILFYTTGQGGFYSSEVGETGAVLAADTWHHVAGVRQGNTVSIYVNGQLRETKTHPDIGLSVDNEHALLFGYHAWGPNFPGQIDEPAVYRRALAAGEIQGIFNAGAAGKLAPATPAPIGLAEWWTADGDARGVRNRTNGTMQNGANYAVGKIGQAFNLDGANDYVAVPHNSVQDVRQALTIESWIMKKGDCTGIGAAGNCVVLAKQIASGNADANLRYGLLIGDSGGANQGKAMFSLNTGAWSDVVFSNTIIGNDVWYHVAATYDGASAKIYVNGVLEASAAKTGEILPSTSGTLEIGRQSGVGEEYFNGLIDEPALYDRALTSGEIASIFNAGSSGKSKPTAVAVPSNQLLWLAGDGNSSDSSGANNGTTQNGAAYAVGRVGQSFALDGHDDFILVPDAPALEVSDQLTLEAWINPTNLHSYRQIISKFGNSGNWAYQMGISLDRTLRLDISGNGTDYQFVVSPPDAISGNVWTHVAATFNGGVIKLYVNGVQVADQTVSIASINGGGNTNVTIGRDSDLGGIQYFAGRIDEPAVYNRALSPEEIASIYSAGAAGKLKQIATTGTNAAVGDAVVTYQVAAPRRTSIVPLDENDFPAPPAGMDSTGLLYDIATDAPPTAPSDVCFNLPAFSALSPAEFEDRRVLHLENGAWMNRTISRNYADKTICARVETFSPFAVIDSNLAPTAAGVAIGGRVHDGKENGIGNVRVTLTDENGAALRTTHTNSFGVYRFENVGGGRMYLVGASNKRFQFAPRMIFAAQDLSEIDFVPSP